MQIMTDFNTSHVTVYPDGSYDRTYDASFQYISCYCLSQEEACKDGIDVIFQYISCYCLSRTVTSIKASHLHFNTSHVTVYRAAWEECDHCRNISIHLMLLFISNSGTLVVPLRYFNTSHVTVYRYSSCRSSSV